MDESHEIEINLRNLEELLKKLVDHWHLWGIHENLYLEVLTPELVANPKSGDKTEVPLLAAIARALTPEDWKSLAGLIREFRAGGDKRDKRLREAILSATGKKKQSDVWLAAECEEHERQQEQARLDLVRQLATERLKTENKRREQQKEIELQNNALREKEKKTHIESLKVVFQQDFLNAYSYWKVECSGHITAEEFEAEKVKYVQTWIEKYLDFAPDPEQAAAIGAIEGHVQVVARAGSGKTATLINRALFLQQHCGVSPDEMLLLAFNKNAAEEMQERLSAKSQGAIPHTMTFHALAYALVHPGESILFDEPDGSQSKSRVMQNMIDYYIHDNNNYRIIQDLMMAHFREDWERIVLGGYDKTPQEMLLYRRSLPNEAIDGTYLKSFGEKVIADFLFEHNIKYRYEYNFWWNETNYHPDFTLFNDKGGGVVIEYFGLEGDPDYDKTSKEKRQYWERKPNWHFLEYSPRQLRLGKREVFLSKLKEDLENAGIVCERLDEKEIWSRIKDRAIDRFTNLVVNFIQRCRKKSLAPQELAEIINLHKCTSGVEKQFLSIAQKFYKAYLDRLKETGEDDFDGLMQKATEAVLSGKTKFQRKSGAGDLRYLQYVLIDEYQDFSDLFHRLITAFRQRNPGARFFCVGDDWQAINGFAGSDLSFYENFQEFFQPSRKLYLTANYRSSISVVDVGNRLMSGRGIPAHPSQNLQGAVTIADLDSFQPTYGEQQIYRGDRLTPAVLRIVNKAISGAKKVVLLSRRNTLPWYVNYGEKQSGNDKLKQFLAIVRKNLPQAERKKVSIFTVHRFKGLEQKVVVILDAVVRCYPLLHPDLVFTRILGDSLDHAVDEERRLFYVALTRAAENLFIITADSDLSPFLEGLVNPAQRLEWPDYPPLFAPTNHIIVKVGNQSGRGAEATFAIKDLLKACGYRWTQAGWPAWVRSYPSEGFSVDELFNGALWLSQGDGIEVRLYDDVDSLRAVYRVDGGEWCCVDNAAQLCNLL